MSLPLSLRALLRQQPKILRMASKIQLLLGHVLEHPTVEIEITKYIDKTKEIEGT